VAQSETHLGRQEKNLREPSKVERREALIEAGVPSDSIQIGEYGDKKLMDDRQIGLLVSTIN
jgi:hypothetical protein